MDRAALWHGPVLLIGGSRRLRVELARAIHARGVTWEGWFWQVDAAQGIHPGWLHAARMSRPRGTGGTLFIDGVEGLPEVEQRRLLQWIEEPEPVAPTVRPWRLVAGVGARAEVGDSLGRVLPPLLDSLDKWRIDLRTVRPNWSEDT